MRWDDIEILRTIDRHQRQRGGTELWMSGLQLMEDMAGGLVVEEERHRGFVRELLNLRDGGYVLFRDDSNLAWGSERAPHLWLQGVRDFALTTDGQDRARGRVVIQPLPDASEDDGRPISSLILTKTAAVIEAEYRGDQVRQFLQESGILLDRVPLHTDVAEQSVLGVLVALDQWGSEGRRILRQFVGQWLDDRLMSGPDNEVRAALVERLARQGWYVKDGRLVIGDRAAGRRVTSPVLRDARLATLHEDIGAIAGKFMADGRGAVAVFEAMKVVTKRLKSITGLDVDGTRLVGEAFGGTTPRVMLADRSTETGRDIHDGFHALFRGAIQAIRNPSAHEQLDDIAENDAFERLNLASLLMHQLDQAMEQASS
jgi:uncharacterized protein (TIGR02391 family)